MPRKPHKPRPVQPYEVKLIQDKWQELSDEEIASQLPKRKSDFVQEIRHRFKLYRSAEELPPDDSALPTPGHSEEELVIRQRLHNADTFQIYKATLTPREISFYENKYTELHLSLGDLTPSEEDNLHLMVMEMIQQARIASRENKYRKEVDERRKEGTQASVAWRTPKEDFGTQHDNSVKRYQSLQRSLKASRDQRLKGRQGSNVNLVSIVQQINSERQVFKIQKEFDEIIKDQQQWQRDNPKVIKSED